MAGHTQHGHMTGIRWTLGFLCEVVVVLLASLTSGLSR